jgi:hypothetical protein
MERNALIFHGSGGRPEYCWYPWLGARLEARGYAVELPHYPGLNADPIEAFLPTVLANHAFDGANAAQGRIMFDHLGGTQIVRDEGHFGDMDDPYESFELLDRLID